MAKNKEIEALYKLEGLRRIQVRRYKRKVKRLQKKERQVKLNEFDGRCCEYASYGQTSCDWSC